MLLDLYRDRVDQDAVTADGFLPTRPRGFGAETLEAGFDAARAPDEWGRSKEYRRKQYDDAVAALAKATGGKLVSPSVYEMDRNQAIKDFGISGPGLAAAIEQHRAQVDQALADAHDIYPDVPSPADFDKAIAEESIRRRDREALMSSTSSFGGSVGLFLGSMAGEMTHPLQVMVMPFGGTGGAAAKSTLARLATSAAEQSAIAAGTQTALEVGDYYSRKRFGTSVGLNEAAFNILTAAAGGAILDSAVKSAPIVFGAGARAVAAGGRAVVNRFARAPRSGLDAVNVAESDAFTVASNPGRPADVSVHAETLNQSVAAVDGMTAPPRQPTLAPARARAPKAAPPQGMAAPSRVFTASGRGVDVAYEVVEARSLVTSHGPDMQDNPAFPAELQPRDRTRFASQTQIAEIAARLEPQRLGAGSDAATGAPIVGPDNVVESGNGRVLALQQAFRRFPEKARDYREYIAAQGFDAGDMAEPVLVRRRVTGLTPEARIAFTREANEATIMAMGAGEAALSDAKRIPNGILELYRGGDLALVKNRGFARKVVDALPVAERAAMITADGELSQSGVKRLEAALLAKAYGDANLIAKLTESTDNDMRAIGKALTEAAPSWAQMRARAAAGEIAPGMDATADLLSAVRVVERARQESMPVGDLLRQGQMFGDGLTEPAYGFLRAMFRDPEMSRPAAQSVVSERLGQFVDEANKTSPGPDMFGNAPVAPGEVLGVRAPSVPDTVAEPVGSVPSVSESAKLVQRAMDTELDRLLYPNDIDPPLGNEVARRELLNYGFTKAEVDRLDSATVEATFSALEVMRKQREYMATSRSTDGAAWAEWMADRMEIGADTAAGLIAQPAAGLQMPPIRTRAKYFNREKLDAAAQETLEWANGDRQAAIDALRQEITEGRVRDDDGVYHADLIEHLQRGPESPDSEVTRLLEAGDFEVPVEVVEVDGTRQIKTRSAREVLKEADAGIRAARQVGLCAVGLAKGAAE